MIVSLEYIHKLGVLHRDIKPENIVIDKAGNPCILFQLISVLGYLRITDLGIARVWRPENAKDTSGTPGYMAPEVMCR